MPPINASSRIIRARIRIDARVVRTTIQRSIATYLTCGTTRINRTLVGGGAGSVVEETVIHRFGADLAETFGVGAAGLGGGGADCGPSGGEKRC
jgi:hypothetical protein